MEIAGGFFLLIALFIIVNIVAWVVGIVLAFRASIILGIICLFLHVPFVLFGWVKLIGKVDLADRVAKAFPELFVV